MSGADIASAVLLKLRSPGVLRLGSALALSLLGHALLLSWPLPLSSGGEAGAARAAVSTLRVSVHPVAEASDSTAREDIPARDDNAAADAPALSAVADQAKSAATDGQGTRDALPLLGYYPAASLSRMPEGIGIFDIQPPAGGDTGIGGKMTIRVWISAKGAIDSLRVLASGLPAAYAEAALAAFEKMHFAPGEIGGAPVSSWVDVVIEYADFRGEAAQAPDGTQ